ncbi:MAG: glycosyltransferase, partial [Armatimonadota bacterium]|nr:glycosyltransferase [Armatimonadota bacterium]
NRLGVACVTRPVGGGAKAGNIEFARQELGAVGDALLVIFDADQVAEEEFLVRTIPYFQDPSLGWVQTGQYYRNLENPVARWANDQQGLFYGVLCPGKAKLNAAFICGTNVVLRASALDEIGGLPQDSVTEDFAASLLLHPRWRSLFLTEVLATGLGPMDIKSYFAQQGRWATGTLGALRRHWRALLLPSRAGLTRPQKIQYLLACTHYLSGLRDLIYLAVPFLFLLMGVSAIQGTTIPIFLTHFLPYWALSQIAFWHASWRKTTFRGIILSFGCFPVLLASLLLVVVGQRTRFAITPKKRSGAKMGMPLFSQMLALGGCCVGLVMATASQDDTPLVLLSAFWLLYMFFLLAGILWLGFRDWQTGNGKDAVKINVGPGDPPADTSSESA